MPKVREFFPKRGIKRKTLFFFSNLPRIPELKRQAAYRGFLRNKSKDERQKVRHWRRVFRGRLPVFQTLHRIVEAGKYSNLKGIVVFGGTVKRESGITDLDLMLVGRVPVSEKRKLLREIESKTGLVPDCSISIPLDIDPNDSRELLEVFTPQFFGESHWREWTVQNFIGPLESKRKLLRLFARAHKEFARQEKKKRVRLELP